MSDQYIGVLLEEVRDQNKAILEAVGDMQRHVARIPKIEADVEELKSDTKVVTQVLTETNRDVRDHERRITALEATAHA